MKFQFGTRTLLLAIACVAISMGGALPFWRALSARDLEYLPTIFGRLSPVLVPMFFVVFAVGRRELTLGMVIAFAICEAAAALHFVFFAH